LHLTCHALKVANGHISRPSLSIPAVSSQSLHEYGKSAPIPDANPTLHAAKSPEHEDSINYMQTKSTD
jgi:hypothetical protein